MRNIVFCLLFVLTSFQVFAQNVAVKIKVTPASEAASVNLYVSPLLSGTVVPAEMKKVNNEYTAELASSPSEFYNVISVRNGAQMFFPVYCGNRTTIEFSLDFANAVPRLSKATAEDKALGQYFEYVYANDKKLWTVPFESVNEVRPFLEGYLHKADSLANTGLDAKVAEYLKMWAYTHTSDVYTSLPMAARIKLEDLPFKRSDILKEPVDVLDSSIAMLFRSAPQIVFASLSNKRNLNACLTQLHATYTEPNMLKTVTSMVVENYLSTFNYEANYDKGLAELKEATQKFGLKKSYVENFEKCKATIKGQAFPAGVVLKDVDGKVVDFSSFRGKYVYIDMWASWCGPCCKEVPVLQQLEKNLKNDKVVFLSVSLDTNETQWKKKMQQLNMHGNQVIDTAGALGNALNVRGIPFFLIYDPDGKLYMYDAPRPSQGQGLVNMLENL